MLITKNGKRQTREEIEISNQDKIRKLGKMATYKYLRLLEANTIKHV